MAQVKRAHRMPYGAELAEAGGVRFRLWAPAARSAELALEDRRLEMSSVDGGWFERLLPDAAAGTRYRFRIDGTFDVPDPASRFQPEGVHGPSEVIDPSAFHWSDAAWRGRPFEEAVIYELHVGAFTPAGSFAGAVDRLDHLAELGVTAIELMPIAEFPGRRNWGYDGVLPFAPANCYGRPEELKRLVQECHARGLMLFLDVVYNHFGPEGNQLARYAPQFFTTAHSTPWGAAIDFEDPRSRPVRDFFVHNALYWIEEQGIDGLRLDAVHQIHDRSRPDFLVELAERVQRAVGGSRHVHLVLENDDNRASYLEREPQGRPRYYAAQWNDDAHHALHVLLTGETGGYYADYCDAPADRLARCLSEGFAYQGEPSLHRGGRRRGEASAHLPPLAFVAFLQNHDQIGNRALGERLICLADPTALRAAVSLLLLAPSPPLLFMGEEWGCAQPFPFFCDFGEELSAAVREGRAREFARFPEFADEAVRARIPDATSAETFSSAVLRWEDAKLADAAAWLELYRHLLALRRREIAPRLRGVAGHAGGFERSGAHGLRVHWRLGDGSRLWLRANLGPDPNDAVPASPASRLLHSSDGTPALLTGALPSWSLAFSLEADAGPSSPR